MTDSVIHVFYEEWEPCLIPILNSLWPSMSDYVTHFYVDLALFIGIFSSIQFIFNHNFWNSIVLFLSYSFLRCIHYYHWNNHYYLNMLELILFTIMSIPATETTTGLIIPIWHYYIIQLLFGSVYFFAGLSKISTSWIKGDIAETMIENYAIWIPDSIFAYGGLALDLFGGIYIIARVLIPMPHTSSSSSSRRQIIILKGLDFVTVLSFLLFHGHNAMYMFRSIQFFPINMLCATALVTFAPPPAPTAATTTTTKVLSLKVDNVQLAIQDEQQEFI